MIGKFGELYNSPLPENPTWISGGVLPKDGILLMGGWAKIGKTFLLLDLIHHLGSGGGVWGTKFTVDNPARVLFIEQEVGRYEFQRRVKMRYEALGYPPPENLFFRCREKGNGTIFVDTASGLTTIRKAIQEVDANVLVIDPIGRFMIGDENSNQHVGQIFANLDGLIADHQDLSIVLSHHFGKPPRGDRKDDHDPLSPYNFRGAAKWFDAPDTLVTFMRVAPKLKGEWWRLHTGWTMRQAAPPEETITLKLMDGGLVDRVVPTRGALKPALVLKG